MRFHKSIFLLSLLLNACQTSIPTDLAKTPGQASPTDGLTRQLVFESTPSLSYILPLSGEFITSPTPDAPHYTSVGPRDKQQYIVQSGDILSAIAEKYSSTVEAIVEANDLLNP